MHSHVGPWREKGQNRFPGGAAARVGSPGKPPAPRSSQGLLRLAEPGLRGASPGRAGLAGPLAAAGPRSQRAPGAGPARPPELTPPRPPGLRGRAAPRPPPSAPAAGPGRARAVPGGRRAPRAILPALGPPRATAYRREEPAERSRAPRRPGVGVTPQHPWGGGSPRVPTRPGRRSAKGSLPTWLRVLCDFCSHTRHWS